MQPIEFSAALQTSGSWRIVRLPEQASRRLPSRGTVFIQGTAEGTPFSAVLEPDGEGGHWFPADGQWVADAGITVGTDAVFTMRVSDDWPEPDIPEDLRDALKGRGSAADQWADITPLARREWIRWIRSTANADTRRRRIEVTCDKLAAGERRPCCFNRNLCTVPEISKGGRLTVGTAAGK